jgi:hypothetical protein
MQPRDGQNVKRSVIDLEPGDHAIFGYGSLLSLSSLERTLGRTYNGPFIVCSVSGWRRTWDVSMPNDSRYAIRQNERVFPERILYLNVRRQASSVVNGVVFVISQKDLLAYDQREWIYNRVSVTGLLSSAEVHGGEVWLYEGKAEYILSPPDDWRKAAVRSTYLEIVNQGLGNLGPEFTQEFWANTDPIPKWLVVDDRSVEVTSS